MLNEKDIEFANKLNTVLQKNAKENQMPNCNFIMKCKILERHKSLQADFIEYKKIEMQDWIYDSSDGVPVISDRVPVILKYFADGINLKEITYEDLLYSPIEKENPISIEHFTSWFYTNNFDINNPYACETLEFTGINSNRNTILEMIKEHFGNKELSFYTIIDEPNELSRGYIFSHSYHLFVCSDDRILIFEFDMYD